MDSKETMTGLSKQTEPILIYILSFLGLIFSFMKDKVDKEVRWVYNQAGAIFIVYAATSLLSGFFLYVPIINIIIGATCGMVNVTLIVFSVIAIIKAYHEEHYEIPLISDIAKAIWKNEDSSKKVKVVEVKKETKKSAKKED